MITREDKKSLKRLLNEAFGNFSPQERKDMYHTLITKPGAHTVFCIYNGGNIARIGVKFDIGENGQGKFYYVTEHDSELLDL